MNILFIDDDPVSIAPAIDILSSNGFTCDSSSFEDFNASNSHPDVIILDMMNGSCDVDQTGTGGKNVFDRVWEHSFCPIVVYSANPDLSNAPLHPFIQRQKKGKDSETQLLEHINRFVIYLNKKESLISYIRKIFTETLRDTALSLPSDISLQEIGEIMMRLTRRRIAASMDLALEEGQKLRPYEQYIYPPLGKDWLQGDIIQNIETKEFALVLSPSCDLVVRKDGHIKTDSILCAHCIPFSSTALKDFLPKIKRAKGCEKCNSCDVDTERCKAKRIREIQECEVRDFSEQMNLGTIGKYYVLPGLMDKFDDILANLKDLFTIKESAMKEFRRVASIDSPFREKLNESFFHIAGRLGTPDRDLSELAQKYVEETI